MSPAPAPAKPARRTRARGAVAALTRIVALVATRRGARMFRGDRRRKTRKVDGPHFPGHRISHLQFDPRDGRTRLAAARTGHLGPTIVGSTDLGRRCPGLRFRVVDEQPQLRPNMPLFVNGEGARDMCHALRPGDVVAAVPALSGA